MQLCDISPLSGLYDLWSLSLSNNFIYDLSPLSALHNLTSLDLSGNAIQDFSLLMERPFTPRGNDYRFDLSYNQIQDIGSLPALEPGARLYLILSGNPIDPEHLPPEYQYQGRLEKIILEGTEAGTHVTFQFH